MKMNESKLFVEELARRNPDWKKIVSVHNDLQRKLDTAVEALKRIREVVLKTDWKLAQQIDDALEKVSNCNKK